MSAQDHGAYADVNGLRVYCELHGAATTNTTPLVLLHGGVGGITMFGAQLVVPFLDQR